MKSSQLIAAGFDFGTMWPLLLLGVLVIAYCIFAFINRRKYVQKETQMRSELKVGDKVVTNAGVYGTIVSMEMTNFGKVILLETGEGSKKSYLSINASVILGLDLKETVAVDADGNPILPEEKKENKKEEKKAEIKKDEVKPEETEKPKRTRKEK